MGETLLLSIVLLVAIMIVVIIQVVQYRQRKKQRETYPDLWQQFELSMKEDRQDDVLDIGYKLFYHKFLPTEHLKIIHDTAQELESKTPEFKDLRLNAQNKLLQRTNDEQLRK